MLGPPLIPSDFLLTAKELANAANRKPRQSSLNRAISTAYYAMFHALARCCADTMIGGSGSVRSKPAWRQVYRALEHGFAKNACSNEKIIALFPQEIQDFANIFVTMQAKRHIADYDPEAKLYKSAVNFDIGAVDSAIAGFDKASIKNRRAFSAWVLFKAPKS